MNWYERSKKLQKSEKPNDDEIHSLAKWLLDAVWYKMPSKEDRYRNSEIQLFIDNDEDLNRIVYQWGENFYEIIMQSVKEEAEKREEKIFSRRRNKIKNENELFHLIDIVKNRSWDSSKKNLFKYNPSGQYIRNIKISDEEAEILWGKLYNATKFGTYNNIKEIALVSPIKDEYGKGVIKRVSEIKNWDKYSANPANIEDANKYEETQIFNSLFGFNKKMPEKLVVYRGVSRADSTIRPGDYVTPNRDYARSYIRGKNGAILKDILNVDDLILSKVPYYDVIELIYYPRSFEKEIKENPNNFYSTPPITFKQFWGKFSGKQEHEY